MDNNDKTKHSQPMAANDDLAKTLNGLQFEETPVGDDASSGSGQSDDFDFNQASADSSDVTPPSLSSMPAPSSSSSDDADEPAASKTKPSDLDDLKNSALSDLRPLVDKLNLEPQEKFDTLLLIIRSTDDQSLLQEALDAAKHIGDDTKRAQALLDVIKEADYFKGKQ